MIEFDIVVYTMDHSGANAGQDGAFLNVSFYMNGEWTDPQYFYNGVVRYDEDTPSIRNTYQTPGSLPEKVKLMGIEDMNDYGFWKVVLDYTCPYILIEHPNGVDGGKDDSDIGYWIGDDELLEHEWPVGKNRTTTAPEPQLLMPGKMRSRANTRET